MALKLAACRFAIAALGVFALGQRAQGYEIDYAPDRAEALRACDAERFRGLRAEAALCYSSLVAGHEDPRIRAEAAHALGNVDQANRFFQQAIDAYPEDPALRVRWGKLYATTFQKNVEVGLYQEARGLDASYVPAIVALAVAAADRFEGAARELVDEALSLDPDAIGAHLLLARMELEVGNLESAEVSLDRALELIESRGLPPVEVYALRAALDLLRGVPASPWIERALEYNPRYGDAYATPAYFFVITRRYREAVDYYQRAIGVEPDNWKAHTELGINLLRDNRVEEAYRHLEIAYEGEGRYSSSQTVNTGRLIDSFVDFTVETFDAETDPKGAGAGVILKLHNDETAILTPYVLELINDSIATFSERYGFVPEEPVIAELYPEADDFSVRTAGLPGIGLLGVTFGYVVAMNSPPRGLGGSFHWGTTLWHEMAHVFTLEATDHLVPRWFSEGVSVYEEWSTGPLPGRHIPSHVLQAMAEDRFLPVSDLDEGFIRPTYENQVIVSYMQAGLICEYIAETFGQAALRTMLERFRAGDDTAAALETALEIPPEEFDRRFALHVEAELGAVLANIDEWTETQRAMLEAAEATEWAKVRELATRSLELMPGYVDTGSAYLYLARAERDAGDLEAARETLAAYHRRGGHAPDALLQLARWQNEAGAKAAAIEVLESALLVAPLDESVHAELGDLLVETRPADALREFTVLGALAPHDQASLNLRLARAYLGLDNIDKAKDHLSEALTIAPQFREAQRLLLEIVRDE